MKKFSLLIALFLLFCFLYGFQKQQKQEKPLEHEVKVELVIVEVFVTDKEGNFVDDLTKDDFEIFEDGKKVKIQYFAVVKPEEEIIREEVIKEIPEAEKAQPPQKMKLAILFDNLNTNRFFLSTQWPQIEEMIKTLSSKVEETMIMELSREYGARIIQPFTSDQNMLSDGISKFKFDLSKSIQKEIKRQEMENLEREARKRIEDRFISNPFYVMDCILEEEKFMRRQRVSDSFGSFLAAVNHIRKFEGIKAVLIVSDGFHLERHSEKGVIVDGGHYGYIHRGIVRLFDPFSLFGEKRYHDQDEALERLVQLINEERLIFYAFSPKELRSDFSVTAPPDLMGDIFKDEMEHWAKERYSLERIADETGGMYLKGKKKYESFLKELGRDLTHFYDISYEPRRRRKKGYHRIEVKVKRPGLQVRHKKGYSDFTEEELEKRRLASAFLSPSLFKDIAFACKTDFIALRGSYLQFWVRLKVPLDQFKKVQDVTSPDDLALLFGINEWSEKRVHTGGRVLRIRKAVDAGNDILYRAFITSLVDLKPGNYETRLVLKQGENRMGGWEASVKIPDVKKGNSLNLITAICGFLTEEEKKNTFPFSVSIGDGSLLLSGHRFYPFVENVFGKGRSIALFLQTCIPSKIKDFTFQFSLRDDENDLMKLPFEKIESFFDEKLKILSDVYLLDFKDVQTGKYQLNIKSSDGKIEKGVEVNVVQ